MTTLLLHRDAHECIYSCRNKVVTMKTPITVTYDCYETIEKAVRNGGNSGRVFVPKSWAGRKVRILLMEPIEEGERVE